MRDYAKFTARLAKAAAAGERVVALLDEQATVTNAPDAIDRSLTLKSLRAQISFVPQETLIIHGTLAENIALGAGRKVLSEEIEAAARLAYAHDFILAQASGYDTQVAERGATLSAGQRQRIAIAIARASLRNSPILIFDEPTVGLDRKSEAVVADAIVGLSPGRAVLLITHDLQLAARMNRVLVLDDGTIVEDGSPEDLMRKQGSFSAPRKLRSGSDKQSSTDALAS